MKIINQYQYNQGISKFKLLSSTAGVGSIITTKHGYYVLILDINKWKFVKWVNARIKSIRDTNSNDNDVFKVSEIEISNRGLGFINDKRFVNLLKKEKNLENLVCLFEIPHMSLNEVFNTPNWKRHPVKLALDKSGESGKATDYMINATHFPKWFKNKQGKLKRIEEWKKIWLSECQKHSSSLRPEYFAPPRDGNDCIGEFHITNEEHIRVKIREYRPLEQLNLVFICPNGHLSDIPWSKYLNWKINYKSEDPNCNNLFDYDNCCQNPNLIWSENKNKSEGYGSIYLHCECGAGQGDSKVNLEGINNIQPYCKGQKPWEVDAGVSNMIPTEPCFINGEQSRGRQTMRIALVTANNVYFASGFSSLYIPIHLAENIQPEVAEAIEILTKKYEMFNKRTGITKEEYWNKKLDFETFLIENDLVCEDEDSFAAILKQEFLKGENNDEDHDFYEHYRWQEFNCFSQNHFIKDTSTNKGIKFSDIILPINLGKYFKKIIQVEELSVTQVQLDFSRKEPKERIIRNGSIEYTKEGQNIYSIDSNELFVLPANNTFGEGLFFQFDEEAIENWISTNQKLFDDRFRKQILNTPDLASQGAGIKQKIYLNGIKHYLIHTFSHIIMRELEFSCGYPTASLKERLYISMNPEKIMSGVLIYTAEGSEGSMGGLVSQGEPDSIANIIQRSLERALNCSSDPLCWEAESQGIFDLNLAACFSCSLVSETACEELNLGLDRRVLVDSEFGYFKELLE